MINHRSSPVLVKKIFPRYTDLIKSQFGVVDSVEPHSVSHVFDRDAGNGLQIIVANSHQNSVDALIDSFHLEVNIDKLGELREIKRIER